MFLDVGITKGIIRPDADAEDDCATLAGILTIAGDSEQRDQAGSHAEPARGCLRPIVF